MYLSEDQDHQQESNDKCKVHQKISDEVGLVFNVKLPELVDHLFTKIY